MRQNKKGKKSGRRRRRQSSRTSSLKPVVVMHDFFVDRIMRLKDPSLGQFVSDLSSRMEAGGGSIRGIEQAELKGGNAVNVAHALSRLGATTCLITVADDLGSAILHNAFSSLRNNSKLRIIKGRPGYTVSLEVPRGGGGNRANIMFSDVGDLADFGPGKLGRRELGMIRNAGCVVMVNWATNLKGTELALKAFRTAGKKALCFLDPADFSSRREEFVGCLERLSGLLDVLSINENECRLLMGSLGLEPLPATGYSGEDVVDAAKSLAEKLSLAVDLHTPLGAATSVGMETVFVQSFDVGEEMMKISTGAGDAWDAADIFGYLCKMAPSERLLFANAAAALYVSDPGMVPPRLNEVKRFLSKSQ